MGSPLEKKLLILSAPRPGPGSGLKASASLRGDVGACGLLELVELRLVVGLGLVVLGGSRGGGRVVLALGRALQPELLSSTCARAWLTSRP